MTTISRLCEIETLEIEQNLVSFDVFDTLVYRRYLNVNEVHDLASAFALSLLGQFGKEAPGALTLTRYATTDAMKTAAHVRIEEPSLEDVWARLFAARLGHSERSTALAHRVAAFEFEIDRQNLYAVDGAAEMLTALRRAGKRIVAVSDMYFSGEQIREILEKAELLSYFDRVFVSADENLTKHSGNLFGHVWKAMGVSADDALHVGDNTYSDVAMPLSLGAEAIHVAHAALLKIERPDYGRRPDIHKEVGDLSKLFLAQLMLHAQSDGTDKLFFLSRDGCLLHKVLEQWNLPLFARFFSPMSTEDLFLSRATTCWLNVNFQSEWLLQSIGHAFWLHLGKATPRQLSTIMGIEATPPTLDPDRIYHSKTDTFTVLDAYVDAGLTEEIRLALMAKRRDALNYLRDAGFFGHRSVHVSDVGYSGTVVRDLNTFFLQEGLDDLGGSLPLIHFHCIATNGNYSGNSQTALPHVIFQDAPLLSEAVLPPILKESFAWLEMFFKHPLYGPLLGFEQRGGKTVPVYEVGKAEDPHHPSHQILATVASDPSDIVFLWMAAAGFWSEFTTPLIDRFVNPNATTIEQMLSDVYEIDAVSEKTRSVVLIAPEMTDEQIHARARDEDYWIPGSIAASRLAREAMRPDRDPHRHARLDALVRHQVKEARRGGDESFDPAFYRRFYRDLHALPNDRALEDHYLTHGRLVGRYGSEAAMRAEYRTLMQEMPPGFDAGAYFMANPDLPVLEPCAWRAAEHYKNVGRAAGRPYLYSFGAIDAAFEDLVENGTIVLTPEEQQQHAEGAPARVILLHRYDVISGPWLHKIDLQEFNALNFEWCKPARNVAEAALALAERGIERLAPLSLATEFDPQFYRSRYPDVADLGDVDAYRHWLSTGSLLDRAPSEEAVLQALIGQRDFPRAFRWEVMQRREPNRFRTATRVELLEAFLDSAEPGHGELVEGVGGADLWIARAGRAAATGQYHIAETSLLEATRLEPGRGLVWHTLGDFYQGRAAPQQALAAFSRSLETDTPNRWSYLNCVRIAAALGSFEAGLKYLKAARLIWKDTQPWREARQVLFQTWFDSQAASSYDVLPKKDLRAKAHPDTRFKRFLKLFVKQMASIGIPRDVRLAHEGGPILILSGSVITERTRWEALLRKSGKDGRRIMVFSREQLDLFTESLPGASVAVFHEVEIDSQVIDVLLTAGAAGVRRVFWAGPLGRTENGPDLSDQAWSNFLLARDGREVGTTLRSIYAACLCDESILTTPALVSSFNTLGVQPHLGRSALMDALDDVRDLYFNAGGARRIFCALTGRLAEQSAPDEQSPYALRFDQKTVLAQLGVILREHPDVTLLLEGADPTLPLPLGLEKRIERLDNFLTFDQRLAALGQCVLALDIRHQPRDQRSLRDEAAWHGVPTIALIDAPLFGGEHIVASLKELRVAVADRLSDVRGDDPALRRELEEKLAMESPTWLPLRALSDVKPRPRVLLANVFAPPQTIGGATRVLADNLDYLIDHASEDYEFALLASDDENAHRGVTRFDEWRGVPVFRIATPQEIDMDWRTYNSEVDLHAGRVIDLFKPDLVHIHCLPRLSVAVAEACRKRGVPYIVTIHDAWWLSDFPFLVQEDGQSADIGRDPSEQPYSHRIGLPRSLERAARMRSALKGAVRRLSVSEPFAEIYRKAGLEVTTIANGVSPLASMQRTVAGPRVRLGHIGGLQHHKGAYLIEAALRSRRFSNLSLTILDHARDPGAPLQTVWGTTPVTIRGKVPAEKITSLYQDMDALLAPSTWPESFGLVSREAAQCGLWVIASDQGAMGTDIVDGETGFVIDTLSPADLVRAFEVIDADPERFRQSPPDRSGPSRGSDDQARDLLKLYRDLLARS